MLKHKRSSRRHQHQTGTGERRHPSAKAYRVALLDGILIDINSNDQHQISPGPQRRQSKTQQGESKPQRQHHDDEAAEAGSASPPAPDSKTQRLREKNMLAAAEFRSRQRKQVQTTESKYNHLSAANAELKRRIREW